MVWALLGSGIPLKCQNYARSRRGRWPVNFIDKDEKKKTTTTRKYAKKSLLVSSFFISCILSGKKTCKIF